jgi:glutamyl-tRNA synthetase
LLLYRAFGWEMPKIAHLPLLRNADRSKLSKRKNPTSILFYKRMGYLPEALANFLGLLSVPPIEGEELMEMSEMIAHFSLEKISLGGPIFDIAKLDWLNGRYLREKLDDASFGARVREWALNESYLSEIAPLARSRIERLSDLAGLCSFLFAGRLDPSVDAMRGGKLDDETLRKAFVLALAVFDTLPDWTTESAQAAVRRVGDVLAVKLRDIVRPFYVATTGSAQSLPLFESMELLGRDLVRERFRVALEKLGGAKNAEAEQWKKLLDAAPLVTA